MEWTQSAYWSKLAVLDGWVKRCYSFSCSSYWQTDALKRRFTQRNAQSERTKEKVMKANRKMEAWMAGGGTEGGGWCRLEDRSVLLSLELLPSPSLPLLLPPSLLIRLMVTDKQNGDLWQHKGTTQGLTGSSKTSGRTQVLLWPRVDTILPVSKRCVSLFDPWSMRRK